MKFSEWCKQNDFEVWMVALVVDNDGDLHTVGEINEMGGVCDCCPGDLESMTLVRVVDMRDMSMVYAKEAA